VALKPPPSNPPVMIDQANSPQRPAHENPPADDDQRLQVLIADRDGLARSMTGAVVQTPWRPSTAPGGRRWCRSGRARSADRAGQQQAAQQRRPAGGGDLHGVKAELGQQPPQRAL
jgi:hypothetical protein